MEEKFSDYLRSFEWQNIVNDKKRNIKSYNKIINSSNYDKLEETDYEFEIRATSENYFSEVDKEWFVEIEFHNSKEKWSKVMFKSSPLKNFQVFEYTLEEEINRQFNLLVEIKNKEDHFQKKIKIPWKEKTFDNEKIFYYQNPMFEAEIIFRGEATKLEHKSWEGWIISEYTGNEIFNYTSRGYLECMLAIEDYLINTKKSINI